MKIGIYANFATGHDCGGTQIVLKALLAEFAKAASEGEQLVLFGPAEPATTWLDEFAGPYMQIVRRPALPAGLGWRIANKIKKVLRSSSPYKKWMRPAQNGYARSEFERDYPAAEISTGLIERYSIDVMHFPYQEFIVTSCPSIFNPHDLQHLHLPQMWSPMTIYDREKRYRFACDCASRVAVAFDWVADDLVEKFGISRKKIRVIPWGGPVESARAPTTADVDDVRAKYGLPTEYALWPAVPWPHKNHRRLIEALALLKDAAPDLCLVFTGGGSKAWWDELKRHAESMGVERSVVFAGFVAADDLRAIYRGAKMVVAPTLFEAGSGPVVEAWVERVPAACSDVFMLREQAEGAALLFDGLDTRSIATAMEKLLFDDELRNRLIAEGSRRAASFSWKETADGYRNLYTEIAMRR
jgi:glycosyltransferase involved in cell wall biosynthesis